MGATITHPEPASTADPQQCPHCARTGTASRGADLVVHALPPHARVRARNASMNDEDLPERLDQGSISCGDNLQVNRSNARPTERGLVVDHVAQRRGPENLCKEIDHALPLIQGGTCGNGC